MINMTIYQPARKRSITIAGHPTSIRIESLFWDELLRQSRARSLPVSALVAQIDAQRLAANPPPNLASAIRLWLFDQAAKGAGTSE
ncbi:MAG: ribbon-helix-helix domain-containing protein [Sphingopyxis sp.]